MFHDLDTQPSASGSPIFQGDRVVGLHLGYSSDLGQNFAVRLDQLESVDISEYTYELERSWKSRVKRVSKRVGIIFDGLVPDEIGLDPGEMERRRGNYGNNNPDNRGGGSRSADTAGGGSERGARDARDHDTVGGGVMSLTGTR